LCGRARVRRRSFLKSAVSAVGLTTLEIGAKPLLFHSPLITSTDMTSARDDTSETGSGEFHVQWNMADNIFANNIVYVGPSCLIRLNKSQVDKNQPPAAIDHNR